MFRFLIDVRLVKFTQLVDNLSDCFVYAKGDDIFISDQIKVEILNILGPEISPPVHFVKALVIDSLEGVNFPPVGKLHIASVNR